MDPGKLRHSLTVEEWTSTDNGDGTWTETWSDRGTVWAEVQPLSGRELFNAQQVNPQITHRVRMRYFPGLTAEHRLKFGSRVFHLEGPPINLYERDEYHECMCREEPNRD